mmetsp:Transcript_61100/g.169055  ORF Transcript_61100/g.169055 Transcript_61100/m.169055 type:complete len:253 (+) Transcript_61100:272-1030(+)
MQPGGRGGRDGAPGLHPLQALVATRQVLQRRRVDAGLETLDLRQRLGELVQLRRVLDDVSALHALPPQHIQRLRDLGLGPRLEPVDADLELGQPLVPGEDGVDLLPDLRDALAHRPGQLAPHRLDGRENGHAVGAQRVGAQPHLLVQGLLLCHPPEGPLPPALVGAHERPSALVHGELAPRLQVRACDEALDDLDAVEGAEPWEVGCVLLRRVHVRLLEVELRLQLAALQDGRPDAGHRVLRGLAPLAGGAG